MKVTLLPSRRVVAPIVATVDLADGTARRVMMPWPVITRKIGEEIPTTWEKLRPHEIEAVKEYAAMVAQAPQNLYPMPYAVIGLADANR